MLKKMIIVCVMLLMVSSGYCSNQWRQGLGQDTVLGTISPSDLDTITFEDIVDPLERMFATYREGCEVVFNTTDAFKVKPGSIMVSNLAGSIRLMLANTSEVDVTWADIDTGAEANDTYFIYVGTSTATDATFSVKISVDNATPTNMTYFKRIGWLRNDSNLDITAASNDTTGGVNSWAQVEGTDDITNASTWAEMTFDTLDNDNNRLYFVSSGVRPTFLKYEGSVTGSSGGGRIQLRIKVDGTVERTLAIAAADNGVSVGGSSYEVSWSEIYSVGEHYVTMEYQTTAGEARQLGTTYKRTLSVRED